MFFILTGLLVTTVLLDEREKTGSVALGKFYLRRAIRIWPSFYAFLVTALLLRQLGWTNFADMAWIAAATHWFNFYTGKNTWVLSHTWSLSLQEIFYLLWPLLLLRLSTRAACYFSLAAIALWPGVRFLMHGSAAPWPAHLALDNNGFNTIMCGAALALAMRDKAWAPRLRIVGGHIGTLVAGIGVLVTIYALNPYWPQAFAIALAPLRNCAVLAIIWWCVNHQKHWVGQLLQARPLVYVGNISFSLYLWQQLFLGHNRGWVCNFPQNLLFAFAAGTLSYHFFEVPMHGLSSRLRQRAPRAATPPVPMREPRTLVADPTAVSYAEPAEAVRS